MADETSVPSPMVSGTPLASPGAVPPDSSALAAVIRRASGEPAPVDPTVPQARLPLDIPKPQGIDIPPGTEVESHGIDIAPGTEVEKPPSNLSEVNGQPFNPLTDFSVEGLVEAAKKDNNFDPINLLRSAPHELKNNPDVRRKVADAFVELWKYSEKHPLAGMSFGGLIKGAGSIVSGVAQWAYGHGGVISNELLSHFAGDDAQGIRDYARTQAAQNILSLQLAGAQLGLQGEQLAKWVGRHAFGRAEHPDKWTKPLANYSPEDKMDALNDAMAAKDIQEKILSGKTLKGADKLAVPLNPQAIEAESAGNPFSLELMGKALSVPTAAAAKLVPAGVAGAVAEALPKALGKTMETAGKATEAVGGVGEKVSKLAESTVGEYLMAHLMGPPGVILAKGISKAGKTLPKVGQKLTDLGGQLASDAVSSDYAQLAKNATQALPETLANVLAGGALDVGLAETTTQTPAEREGLGLGTLLGAVGAAKSAGKRILGGQLVGERAGAFTPEMTQRLHDVLGTGYKHKQFENEGQAQNWFKSQGLSDADASAYAPNEPGGPRKAGGAITLSDGQKYTYAIGKEQTPHEIVHAFKDSLPPEQQAKLDAATLKNYTPEEIQQAKQQYASALDPKAFKSGTSADDIISKATKAGETSDQYTVNELQAENLMTYIKRAGSELKPKKTIPGVIAKGAAELVSALGGEPLETERSQAEALRFPLKYKEVKGLVKAAKEKITPESVAAAEEQAKHATAAEDVSALGEEHPDKSDVLNTLGQAQERKGGVKLTYSGATGEQPSDLSSDLPGIDADARRAIVEAERESPTEARTPWWKTFFPDRTFETKGGKLQSGGWLPAIFTANSYRFAKAAAATPEIRALSPYEINPKTNFFTPEAQDALQKDVQVAVKNWKDGRTASGVPIQVPENTIQKSGGKIYRPTVGPGGGALDDAKADFISHLMGHKLPNTARLTEGVFPLNVAGQEVSAATMAGRVEAPRPAGTERGIFGEAAKTEKGLVKQRELAKASGVEGRQLLEVNPFRLKLEAAAKAAGVEAPKPVSAYQRLNLDRVLHAEHAEGDFRGNTLTQAAGFEPAASKQEIELTGPDGKKYRARFDGHQDFSAIGKGMVPQITALEDLPGSVVKGSTTYGPSLDKAGYKYTLPTEDKPKSSPPGKFEPAAHKGVDTRDELSDNDLMKNSVEKTVRSAFAIQRAQPKARAEDKKGLEQVVGPRKITLTHLSSNPGLTEVDPAFFGKGKANRNDTRGANKSYWFVKGSQLEGDSNIFGLGGNHQYEATIPGDKIYDLSHDKPDPQGYFSTINREEADTNLKKAGYRGVLVDTSDGRKVVLLYDKQPVKHVGTFEGTRAQPAINAGEITKDIFKNLVPGEGFTYSPFKRELLKSGYAVSIYPERSDVIDPSELSPDRVESFINKNKDLLTRSENSVGGWYDPESGRIYLDLSFTTPSKDLATFAGREYNQKAVGDLAKYAAKDPNQPGEIPTGGTGEPLPGMIPEHKRADELVKDFAWEQPADEGGAEQELMPGLGTRAPLSSKDIGEMSKAELARHFPEALLPRRRGDLIDYNITDSPLAKRAGTREQAVHAYADKLEAFANERIKTPEFQDGLSWYSEFVPMLKTVYGKLHETMAQLLAATSPRNSPTPNFALSNDALEGYKAGRFDKQIAKYLDGVKLIEGDKWESWYNKQRKAGKLVNPRDNPTPEAFMAEWIDWHNLEPRQSNGKLYGMHSVPVLQVLAGNWLNENTGPKTLQFVKNLLGTNQGATIDVWAARTMRRLGYEGSKSRWRILPGNETGVSDKDFHFSQEAFAEAARRIGVSPDSLQGALWFAEKKLWAERGWARLDLGDFRKEIAKVNMLNSGIKQRLAQSQAKVPVAQSQELNLVSPLRY